MRAKAHRNTGGRAERSRTRGLCRGVWPCCRRQGRTEPLPYADALNPLPPTGQSSTEVPSSTAEGWRSRGEGCRCRRKLREGAPSRPSRPGVADSPQRRRRRGRSRPLRRARHTPGAPLGTPPVAMGRVVDVRGVGIRGRNGRERRRHGRGAHGGRVERCGRTVPSIAPKTSRADTDGRAAAGGDIVRGGGVDDAGGRMWRRLAAEGALQGRSARGDRGRRRTRDPRSSSSAAAGGGERRHSHCWLVDRRICGMSWL